MKTGLEGLRALLISGIGALSSALMFVSAATAQDLRKCIGPDGSVTYTNQGCPSASKTDRPVRVTDSTFDSRQDLLAAERIRREQAADAARLRAQAPITGIQSEAKPGPRRADAATEGKAGAGASAKECNDAMPRGLDAQQKAEFIAACMAGKPIAPRPATVYAPPPADDGARRGLYCSGTGNQMYCW